MDSITTTTILTPSSDCTVRKQQSHYLFYNVRTDELHLVPANGYEIYQRFDGITSLGEVETELLRDLPIVDRASGSTSFRTFIEGLLRRGILEGVSYD
jgi:hypothetical protein